MKKSLILIVTALVTLNTFASDLEVKLKNQKLNLLLSTLWNEIPYEYNFPSYIHNSTDEEVISYKIRKGHVKLGSPGSPLFELNFSESDLIDIDWNLDNLEAYLELKIRFKYRSLGVQVTHDEVFIINANHIKNATSRASLKYNSETRKLDTQFQDFENFDISSILIEPKDGIGSVLRYIFDNIFSRREVDRFITKSINKEINKWLKEDHLQNSIQVAVNNLLEQSQEAIIDLPDLASSFSIQLDELDISGTNSSLGTTFIFRNNYPRHFCAEEVDSNKNTDISIGASHRLIETLINNIGTNLRIKDQRALEPLFCFGYKSYDEEGNALGNKLVTRFLGRKINLNYWVRPLTLPKYNYNAEEQVITIDLSVDVKIKTVGYPRIMTRKNPSLELRIAFKVEQNKEGLRLVYSDFLAKSIKGNVKIKWGRLAPTINLSLKTLRLALNGAIKKELKKQTILIMPNRIEVNDTFNLELMDYELFKKGHKVEFAVEPN
jgi:hypothetical protein